MIWYPLLNPPSDALRTDRAVDRRHVTGVCVDVNRVDRDVRLGNQLFVVVGLQIPDVNHSALVSNDQLRLETHPTTSAN